MSRVVDLTSVPSGLRVVALWSTTTPENENAQDRAKRGRLGRPVASLFDGTFYHRWYVAGQHQLPRLVYRRALSPAEVALRSAAPAVTVEAADVALFVLPSGGLVASVAIDARRRGDVPLPDAVTRLYHDLDTDREELLLGNHHILEACCEGTSVDSNDLRLDGDFHGVTVLPTEALSLSTELDRQILMRLVSRRDETSRTDFLTARFPAEPNRYPDGAAAVTPGASVVVGQAGAVGLAHVISAVQAIAAISALRQIQRRCFDALRLLRGPEPTGRDWLGQRMRDLSELEIDLSFGVEAYLDMRLLVPSLPVEQLHRSLVEALALDRGAKVTGTMLQRLTAALSAEDAALEATRRQDEERVAAMDRELRAQAERQAAARRAGGAVAAGLAAIVALPLGLPRRQRLGCREGPVDVRPRVFRSLLPRPS